MITITQEQQSAIAKFLVGKHIPSGLGNEHEACSIAAINLALNGRLTDSTPDCMSPTVAKWIIGIQDAMPDDMRNSTAWRELLPLAAETGRDHEPQRTAILLDWLWDVVLPSIQDVADAGGYGSEWKAMILTKTASAAEAARAAARAAAYAAEAAADAASAARAAAFWNLVDPISVLVRLIEVSS